MVSEHIALQVMTFCFEAWLNKQVYFVVGTYLGVIGTYLF